MCECSHAHLERTHIFSRRNNKGKFNDIFFGKVIKFAPNLWYLLFFSQCSIKALNSVEIFDAQHMRILWTYTYIVNKNAWISIHGWNPSEKLFISIWLNQIIGRASTHLRNHTIHWLIAIIETEQMHSILTYVPKWFSLSRSKKIQKQRMNLSVVLWNLRLYFYSRKYIFGFDSTIMVACSAKIKNDWKKNVFQFERYLKWKPLIKIDHSSEMTIQFICMTKFIRIHEKITQIYM